MRKRSLPAAAHRAGAVALGTSIDAGKILKISVRWWSPVAVSRPAEPAIIPCTGAPMPGANSLRDLRHGPPRQGTGPTQALTGGRPGPFWLTRFSRCYQRYRVTQGSGSPSIRSRIKASTSLAILGILSSQTRSCIPLRTFLLSNLEFASPMREGKGEPHVSTR